jgi:hypothetical protein
MPSSISGRLLQELALTDFSERLVDLLLQELRHKKEFHRLRAVASLSFLKGERALQAILEFSKRLQDPSPHAKAVLVAALSEFDNHESRQALEALTEGLALPPKPLKLWSTLMSLDFGDDIPWDGAKLRAALKRWTKKAQSPSPSAIDALKSLWNAAASGLPPSPKPSRKSSRKKR